MAYLSKIDLECTGRRCFVQYQLLNGRSRRCSTRLTTYTTHMGAFLFWLSSLFRLAPSFLFFWHLQVITSRFSAFTHLVGMASSIECLDDAKGRPDFRVGKHSSLSRTVKPRGTTTRSPTPLHLDVLSTQNLPGSLIFLVLVVQQPIGNVFSSSLSSPASRVGS
ncbi:hypothetical protein B0T24DRAFT_220834 [Lasiosphaeria ovina]|uniref:Uncharacterized protein n=1 Tax=Lasiosphaeria ovina TaxID=92902 RepID=A0AAE0NAQ4_9PEZI|nr:hypothetical protein B0T24DRAFT_220834 [Lasiosphaeria ovina]